MERRLQARREARISDAASLHDSLSLIPQKMHAMPGRRASSGAAPLPAFLDSCVAVTRPPPATLDYHDTTFYILPVLQVLDAGGLENLALALSTSPSTRQSDIVSAFAAAHLDAVFLFASC